MPCKSFRLEPEGISYTLKKLCALLLAVSAVAATIYLTKDDFHTRKSRNVPTLDPVPHGDADAIYILTAIEPDSAGLSRRSGTRS